MNDSWTKSQRLWWLFTRGLAPFFAFAWPILCTYGSIYPHALDNHALRLGRGEVAILVGASAAERSYVVVPRSLLTATISNVNHFSDPLAVTEQPGAALVLVAVWIACLYCAWNFWVRPVLGHLTGGWSDRER